MPYIVTTKRPVDAVDAGHPEAPRHGWPVSRRAVATLEGKYLDPLWREAGIPARYWNKATLGCLNLTLSESGGTIWLPDGIVVEVEPASWDDLFPEWGTYDTVQTCVDAFNARQP